VMQALINHIMSRQPWIYNGRESLGPVHGNIGILTQIVLSDPSYASQLESKLAELLDLQEEDGNWPAVPGRKAEAIQFCNGAPGIVISLLAIQEYFPNLKDRMDIAITAARKLIWECGLLVKEPSVCHGIIGNALALEGDQREHFLACTTPEMVLGDGIEGLEGGWDRGGQLEEKFGLLWGEAGRASVWMDVAAGRLGRFVIYTDV
jgi:hypothetical protein